MTKLIFVEYGLLKKTVLDADKNSMAEILKAFCSKMNIQKTITSSYDHQSNGQVEAFMKFVEFIIKDALTLNRDIHLALLQTHSTLIVVCFLSPAMILFYRLIRTLFLK